MRIGELLVRQGLVTSLDIEEAMRRKRRDGGPLGANLVALEKISPQQLAEALHDQRELQQLMSVERTLADWERQFGADHLNTSRARYNLARLRLVAGEAAVALELSRVALMAQQTVLGADHKWTQATTRVAQLAHCVLERGSLAACR
jgi:hypothetical protein